MSQNIDYSKGIYDARQLGGGRMLILGIQHMFAMFGATVLVPLLTGLSVSTTLLCAGLGTLLFHFITKRKVPAFLGSSFAYLGGFSIVAPMLADANGNLQTAIKKAASLAQIKDYHTEYAPTPSPWYEGLFDQQKKDYLNTALQETLGTYYAPLMSLRQIRQMSVLQTRIPYEPNFIN